MLAVEQVNESQAIDLARECLYRFLAAALSDPYGDEWQTVLDCQNQQLASQAADLLRAEAGERPGELARGELPADQLDLEPLLIELRKPLADLRAEYDRVFGLVVPRECPPYETEYHPSSEIFFRSQQLADIAGFYRAFGLDTAQARPERPDHVALELEYMAFLMTKKRLALIPAPDEAAINESVAAERASICEDAANRFFREHLAWWIPAFTSGMRRKSTGGFYAATANVLGALIPIERWRLGIPATSQHGEPDLIERPEEQSGCAACPIRL